ncbi:type IV pilus inner membrane component PilO [Halanaerobium kushneri]|jgi:type IV pilus assembly protein PilO|uniref:Type IV pilus assembly protein PilO n=1 Tax=Halanaerobium kushneri TaxID=56779 RepID=A0A1N6Q7G1_9FIRM|nr:type 4a pilus biogenesis protein PilO [Halanaerobium kushneri]SIQ12425.1 type IV pilus assembly protein PilO [Halanaerobium kushneri]
MFNNLSRREKVLLVLAFVIALIAVYYFYFYQPLKNEISVLKNQRNNRENRLDIAMSFARRLPEIKEEYKNIIAEIESRGEYIDKDIIDLLIDFREIAKANNLELKLYRPTENQDNISMSVNITGGFREVSNLLEDFKEWNYWFEFRDVNISRSEQGVLISMKALYHDRLVDEKLLRKGVETDEG